MDLHKILRDSSMKEMVSHGSEKFPFAYYSDDVYAFENHCEDLHWHNEFEFAYVTLGKLTGTIGHSEVTLQEGEGLFINAGMLHSFTSSQSCILQSIVFQPDFIDGEHTIIFQKYVAPFLQENISHLTLHPSHPGEQYILNKCFRIFQFCEYQPPHIELRIKQHLLYLWEALFRQKDRCTAIETTGIGRRMLTRVHRMTEFIAANYTKSLTLTDIASSANISKSEACRCFQHTFSMAPVTYLIQMRLQRAGFLLASTSLSITEVAFSVGFDSSNYFARMFKKKYQCSPSAYRKKFQ